MYPAPSLHRWIRHRLGIPWLVALWCAVGWSPSRGADSSAAEYTAKAGLICSFAKFVDWPTNAFHDDQSPLVIGVFGNNPFGNKLETAARGKRIRGRTIEVRIVRTAAEAGSTHLLFISSSQERSARECLRTLSQRPVLTVGESSAFPEAGGIITIVRDSERLRFDISLRSSESTGLRISAQMLSVARKVTRPSP